MKGLLCVISSPSGGGKTTVIKEILKRDSSLAYSISATTRPQRGEEREGEDYYFLTEEEFKEKIKRGEFIEWAEVHGYFYGTPKAPIEGFLKQNKVVLLDIDVCGGLAVRREYPECSLLIFLDPPSLESLTERLKKRGTDSEEEIKRRLQRVPWEMEKAELYDYRVINDDLDTTVKEVMRIINDKRRCK